MICNDSNCSVLNTYLKAYGVELRQDQARACLAHLDLVVEKNRVMNLTRITSEREAIIRHVVDSLLLLPSVCDKESATNLRFVDVGTGAGFPGIPLVIASEARGLLIDSVGKKVNAVNEFLTELGLADRASARQIRAEDLAREHTHYYDAVTARAVADLGVLVEYASPLLKMKGRLVVSKGQLTDDELSRGNKTGELVGLSLVSRETYELPEGEGHRVILTYERTGKSRVKLPRQTGMAKHKPLA